MFKQNSLKVNKDSYLNKNKTACKNHLGENAIFTCNGQIFISWNDDTRF